jgi:hypothetical protein
VQEGGGDVKGSPGVDYPEDRAAVDVLAASRGDVVMSFVERVDDDVLVLSAGKDRSQRPVRLEDGERLELVWKDAGDLRALPAELVAVENGAQQLWRVRAVGPATRGQRRSAVRAPLEYRTTLVQGGLTVTGVSSDISEGGVRARFPMPRAAGDSGDAAGDVKELEVGSVATITVWFDDKQQVSAQGELVRRHTRTDDFAEFSIRFIGLPEKVQDLIRREVFAGLRDLRARGAI